MTKKSGQQCLRKDKECLLSKDCRSTLRKGGKAILKGVDLKIGSGEFHAIMGPNGSGKAPLFYVLAGRQGYEVTGGTARLDRTDLLAILREGSVR